MEPVPDQMVSNRISCVIEDKFGFKPKAEQIEALKALLEDRLDTILIARTGFGKSILFQAAPFMFQPTKSILIIMPLEALEKEQCLKMAIIDGCRPFVLNGDSNNMYSRRQIREGCFTHGKLIAIRKDSLLTNTSIR